MNLGKGFIVVHIGAGYHSSTNSKLYKDICKEACMQATLLLRNNASALQACVAAICELENSPWTNAGTGSNLTLSGTVECDASIMDGDTLQYGAVGAVSGIKNPIRVAENLLKTQCNGTMSLGRIPPSTLVGDGAKQWASKKNIPLVSPDGLITNLSNDNYRKHKRKLDMLEEGLPPPKIRHISDSIHQPYLGTSATLTNTVIHIPSNHNESDVHNGSPLATNTNDHQQGTNTHSTSSQNSVDSKERIAITCDYCLNATLNKELTTSHDKEQSCTCTKQPPSDSVMEQSLLDTVGAICVDASGNVVSAVSSGGIALKQPGRLGQAALYGSGCWAENVKKENIAVGLSTSGCGEHLTKTLMARECASALIEQQNPSDALLNVFQNKFIESRYLSDITEKLGGTLAVKVDSSVKTLQQVEVLWAHTTESMCLAFQSTDESSANALISRLPKGTRQGRSCLVQSKLYTI